MTPLAFHGLQVAALIATPLALRGAAILTRPRGQNGLSPLRRARLDRYATSPARADDAFTRCAPRAQRRMLRYLQAQLRATACLVLAPLAAAAGLVLVLVFGGAPRGLWSAPYLAAVLALSGVQAAGRWTTLQDVYLRACSEYEHSVPYPMAFLGIAPDSELRRKAPR